jgi:hypothetical protein
MLICCAPRPLSLPGTFQSTYLQYPALDACGSSGDEIHILHRMHSHLSFLHPLPLFDSSLPQKLMATADALSGMISIK